MGKDRLPSIALRCHATSAKRLASRNKRWHRSLACNLPTTRNGKPDSNGSTALRHPFSNSLAYPIDVATTGSHGNHPRCHVYLVKGPCPSISRFTGIIRHLYFEPYPDIGNNNPGTQMLAFTDETMTELASQILSRAEAQRVILEHRFRTYVQPYLFNVPYSLYGNRESLHVLAQEPSSTD